MATVVTFVVSSVPIIRCDGGVVPHTGFRTEWLTLMQTSFEAVNASALVLLVVIT
jgi:hypothetical protein